MAEYTSYDPSPWRDTHDSFEKARRGYTKTNVDEAQARTVNKTIRDMVPLTVSTKALRPLVIGVDGTGSMGKRTGIIFGKLPYLVHEVETEYCGPDAEISFGCIGDATSGDEPFPLQVRPFAAGQVLAKEMKGLAPGKDGGYGLEESYALHALYYARNCKMPKAARGIYISIGDENPKDVTVQEAHKHAGIDLQSRMPYQAVYAELAQRFDVFHILSPYQSNVNSMQNEGIRQVWYELLGQDHVSYMKNADRVVDVIFAILAKVTGKMEYFHQEITERQRPEQVEEVYASVDTIYRVGGAALREMFDEGSTMHERVGGKTARPLI